MKPECADAVRSAAKSLFGEDRTVSDVELRGIEERLRSSMVEIARKDPNAWRSMTPASRYKAATDLAHQKLVSDMARSHEDTIRDAVKKAGQWQDVTNYKPGLHGQLAALDQRTFFDSGNTSNKLSVETEAKAVANEMFSGVAELPHGDKFFGLIQDRAREQDITRAMFGEKTQDPANAQAASMLQTLFDTIHQRLNDAGIRVHYLDNWRLPQPWDWTKVGGTNHEAFVNDMMAHADRRAYVNPDGSMMNDKELRDFFNAGAETIGTDGANKRAAKEGGGGKGTVGGVRNTPRQFHFANADSYRFMMDKYGSASNLYQMIHHHVARASREIAVAERYGRDADNFFPQLVEKAFANDTKGLNTAELKKLEAMKKRVMDRWEAMRRPGAPGTSAAGAVSQNARGIVASSMLGGSVFYAPQDLATAALYAKTSGLDLQRWTANTSKALTAGKAGRARLARMGLVVDSLSEAGNRLGMEELGSSAVRLINHGVYVLSGTRRLDIGLRAGIGESVMDVLGGLSRKAETMADLPEGDRAYLERTGATDDHFAVWKKAELGMEGGSPDLLTPHAIYAIPDEALRPMAEKSMSAVSASFKAEAVKRDARTQQENEWVQKRASKFNELQRKAADTIAAMKARASVREGAAQGVHEARAEQLSRQLALAEIEHKLERTLAVEKSQDKIRGILTDVARAQAQAEAQFRGEPGEIDAQGNPVRRPENAAGVMESGKPDNTVKAAVNKGLSIGEQLGRERAIAERRVKDSAARVAQMEKDNTQRIDAKSAEFDKRMASQFKELSDFVADIRGRQAKRAEIADAFERQHGEAIAREIRNLRSGAAKQLLATALSEVQTGARAGAGGSIAEKVWLGLDRNAPKTRIGELLNWLLLLKKTPLGIFHTQMFDIPRRFDSWQGRLAYRAAFGAISMATGALAIQLRNLAAGNDPEQMDTMDFAKKMMLASGGMGLWGDFLLGDKGDQSTSALVKAAGPGATAINDAMNLFMASKDQAGQAFDQDAAGRQNYAAQALRFARSYALPFARIWYLKAAFNHLIYEQQMERLAPGYKDRVRKRMAKRNQGSWWGVGETSPERAPDLGHMLGGKP